MSAQRRLGAAILSCLLLVGAAAAVAFAISAPAERSAANPWVTVSPRGEQFSLGNSHAGQAVFSAAGMLPGQTASGEVTISNPNGMMIDVDLAPRVAAAGPLGRALWLTVGEKDAGPLYEGTLAGLSRIPLGTIAPSEDRTYVFRSTLPATAGDALQGESTSVDLVWVASAGEPAPDAQPMSRCRIEDMRSRFFVYSHRNAVRLVAKYRARTRAKVKIAFYERLPGNRFGRRIATMRTTFPKAPRRWRVKRVKVSRSAAEMGRLRRSENGFMARLWVKKAPTYCLRKLQLELSDPHVVSGQRVWFQRGSFGRR